MAYLFSYGSLRRESVQVDTFGRPLTGVRDDLPGYRITQVPIPDPHRAAIHGATHYANVVATDDASGRVSGTVFEVTEDEIQKADRYERADGYARVCVNMASGRSAWVFVFVN